MTNSPRNEKWTAIDLHVHTPASNDYRGSREDSEYLAIIKRASEFSKSMRTFARHDAPSPVSCVAFTDHNSVEGFRKWRQIYDNNVALAEAIRLKDSSNSLLKALDADIELLQSVRVLMGLEVKANPGVHLCLIFRESVKPEEVENFLAEAYGSTYEEIKGDPEPTMLNWTLEQTLDRIDGLFGNDVIVIAPHIENDGGLWEALKSLHSLRIAALKHHAIRALSFNRVDTRDKLQSLFRQGGEYKREAPIAFVQSSDYHGQASAQIGQPRTEVYVPNGRATFAAISEVFQNPSKIKCSVDFTQKDYERLTSGNCVVKFVADSSEFHFRAIDYDRLAEAFCGMSNSGTGIIELEGSIRTDVDRSTYMEALDKELDSVLEARVVPKPIILAKRDLLFPPSKLKLLVKPFSDGRLRTTKNLVFIVSNDEIRPALPHEIETVVARNIEQRFGERFETTLEDVSSRSIRLSKMPEGIALLLKCEHKLAYKILSKLTETVEPVSSKGRELSEVARNQFNSARELAPFGRANGNAAFIWSALPPREQEHYMRYTEFRAEVEPETLAKISCAVVTEDALVIHPGGAVAIVEPGHIISNVSAVLVSPKSPDWKEHLFGITAWLKSSFFIWYCAVHLGDPDLYKYVQQGRGRIPLPPFRATELYRRLDGLARNIWLDEKRFLAEVEKERRRGLDENQKEKMRTRHNSAIAHSCLSIDEEISKYLGLSDKEQTSIAEILVSMKMSDFGFLEKRKQDQAGD